MGHGWEHCLLARNGLGCIEYYRRDTILVIDHSHRLAGLMHNIVTLPDPQRTSVVWCGEGARRALVTCDAKLGPPLYFHQIQSRTPTLPPPTKPFTLFPPARLPSQSTQRQQHVRYPGEDFCRSTSHLRFSLPADCLTSSQRTRPHRRHI